MKKMKSEILKKIPSEMLRLLTSRRPGYKAESAFGTFASRDLARMLGNKVIIQS